MLDRNDFIKKQYIGKDKVRTQKWFMHYCNQCGIKRTYAPANKGSYCQSCASIIKFANKASQSVDQYLANEPNRKLNDKIATRIRNRLNMAIIGKIKSGSAVNSLGCSISYFLDYLESKFQPGMTWDNHLQFGWHIDHIIPLASFDLTDSEQFKIACHHTNMQPLWWNHNLQKGKK